MCPVAEQQESRVIVLRNMVTEEDLNDEEMYAELLDDIGDECAKFGKILKLIVPKRPAGTVVKQPERTVYEEWEVSSCTTMRFHLPKPLLLLL